jgi:hypothetical protein
VGDEIRRRLKRLDFITAFVDPRAIPPGPPLPPPGTEIASTVAFSFTTGTLVLGAIAAGARFTRAAVVIDVAFDDPGASIQLGTSASPGLLLDVGSSRPSNPGQYDSDALVVVPAPDVLVLTVSAGTSTHGVGLLLYKVLP